MSAETTLLDLLAEDRQTISYRPSFARLTGSVNAAILLQQIFYRWYKNDQQPFFKFKEPCDQKTCKEGDSWCEELAFTRWEFDGALKLIGTKITKGKHQLYNWPRREDFQVEDEYLGAVKQAITHIVNYSTDSEHKTWYAINPELFTAAICQPSRTKVEKPRQISGEEKPLSINTENTRDSNTAESVSLHSTDSVSQPSNPKSDAPQNTEPVLEVTGVNTVHGFKSMAELMQGSDKVDEPSGTSPVVQATAQVSPVPPVPDDAGLVLSQAAQDCLRYLRDGNVLYEDDAADGSTTMYTYRGQELAVDEVIDLLDAEYIDFVPDEWMHAGHGNGYRITAKGQARAQELPSIFPPVPSQRYVVVHDEEDNTYESWFDDLLAAKADGRSDDNSTVYEIVGQQRVQIFPVPVTPETPVPLVVVEAQSKPHSEALTLRERAIRALKGVQRSQAAVDAAIDEFNLQLNENEDDLVFREHLINQVLASPDAWVNQCSPVSGLFGVAHGLSTEKAQEPPKTVELPPVPAGYQYVYSSATGTPVHLVKAGQWEHGRALCKASVKFRYDAPVPNMQCVKNGVCPDCLKVATTPKPEKKKRVKTPQPYDVLGEALARNLFGAKDKAGVNAVYGRVAKILHGDKVSGRCEGLIAYEMERQSKDKADLDYVALAADTDTFWKDYRRANPDCQLKDCAKVVDAWQLWRGKAKPKVEEHYEMVEPDMWVAPGPAR